MSEKTIAAISTPLGEGGIGVIRISGEKATEIADSCFKSFSEEKLSSFPGYRATYGKIFDGEEILDDAVALVFRAPKSYTGEDVVELSVHGGRLIVRKTLRILLQNGATLAQGGEFTRRAFLNGKLDLAKAESIMELISAKNDAALKISRAAKDGRVSRETEEITTKLLETAASLAAFADYPDEDIPSLSEASFSNLLNDCEKKLLHLISTYDTGKNIREGIDCVIVGKPNVGKSTLMNLLCGCDRSIVTDVAGTTRDVIETTVTLGDITLNLSDTAGIRKTDDVVEQVGVDLARMKIENAGIILAVFDGSKELSDDDIELLSDLKNKHVIALINKADLPQMIDLKPFEKFDTIKISAKHGDGSELLEKKISELTNISSFDSNDAVLISERQRACVQRAFDAVSEARSALLLGITLDAVGVCIDDAVAALLELTGKRVTNEVTDEVFRRFCVGK